MTADSRLFAGRAVTWAALQHGITQFLDLGSGLPSGESGWMLMAVPPAGARAADEAAGPGDLARAGHRDAHRGVRREPHRLLPGGRR